MTNTPYALCISGLHIPEVELPMTYRITTCRSEGSANTMRDLLELWRPIRILANPISKYYYVSSEIPIKDLKDYDADMYADLHDVLIKPIYKKSQLPKLVVIEGGLSND
tara:strand:+ start:1058 stop:1384 length:327 start_codon:yes stop_codon:yes gene_type:complete